MDFKKLKQQTLAAIAKGEELKKRQPENQEFDSFYREYETWVRGILAEYEGSLPADFHRKFLRYFEVSVNEFSFALQGVKTLEQRVKDVVARINDKISALKYYIAILSVSDRLLNPEIVNEEGRDALKIDEKRGFILIKLGETGNKEFYDIRDIFWGNGITSDDDEILDLIASLEDMGFVKKHLITRFRFHAAITTAGKEYLETKNSEKDNPAENSKETSKQDIEQLNEKIDQILEYLRLNNLGSEILYEELQEMKEASGKIDLKNWGQLLKGKLIGFLGDKASDLSADLARDIYNTVTHGTGLPKLN